MNRFSSITISDTTTTISCVSNDSHQTPKAIKGKNDFILDIPEIHFFLLTVRLRVAASDSSTVIGGEAIFSENSVTRLL